MVVSDSIDLFFHILVLSLVIWGIAGLFEVNMLLASIGKRLDAIRNKHIRWLLKPLIWCPPCMPSVWGTLFAVYLGYGVMHWLLLVLATSGLNYIISNKW
jgi:hypothetical protein